MRKHHVRFGGGFLEKCSQMAVTRQEPTLHLYDKEIAQNAGTDQGRESGQGNSSASQTTKKATTPASASSTPVIRKYGDGTSVNGNVSEQEAFDTYKKTVGTMPASKEALRTWMSSKRTPAPSVAA
jgi:hypothetical protein